MSVTLQLLLYLAIAIITVSLAIYSWQNRQYRGTYPFCGLLIILSYWSVCCTMTTIATTLSENIFWTSLQYTGPIFVGPLWLLFAMAYADKSLWIERRFQGLLFTPGALLAIGVLTNSVHMSWWSSISLDTSSVFPTLVVTEGILFWLYVAYLSLCVLIGSLIIGLEVSRKFSTEHQRTYLMGVGATIPVIGGGLLFLVWQGNMSNNLALLLFTAASACFFVALFYKPLPDINLMAQESLLAKNADGLMILDHQGTVSSINDAAIQLLGLPSEHWTKRPVSDLVSATPLEDELQPILVTPLQPLTKQFTYTMGSTLCSVTLRLERLATDQALAGWLIMLRDITPLTQAQQQLSRQAAELSVINQIAQAIDNKNPKEHILSLVVQIMKQSQPKNWMGIGVFQNQHHHLHLVHNQPTAPSSSTGRWQSEEIILDQTALTNVVQNAQTQQLSIDDAILSNTPLDALLRKYGTQSLLIVPLQRDTVSLGAIFIGRTKDTVVSTDEQQLFDTIASLLSTMLTHSIHDKEVEQVSELKATFLATVSHELRTPLTSVMGFAHLLQIGVFGELPSSADEPLQSIQHHGEVLLGLINDILDFSRIEAEQLEIDTYPVDTTAVVQSISNAFRQQAQERGLAFDVDIAPDLPYVHANSTRLEQILTHLFSNAIKFTETGSITVRAYVQQDLVRISIQDTGIGIAPEHQQRVFREFQQLEDIQTRRVGGTGLGLAISKRLIELMGGTITLESRVGHGSTFYCDLQSAAPELYTDDDVAQTRIIG
ncbi:MAG: histidine kinase N-terminal 7TM domain-containing protein [Chloroflexota bacterium]